VPPPPLAPLVAWGRSLGLTGEVEDVALRPWSTTARLGDVWLKACGSGTAHEPALLGALRDERVDGVALPFAVAPASRYLALPHAGRALRDVAGGEGRWPDVMARHAALQRSLEQRADRLLELGVPDLRPDRAPGLLADLLGRHDPPPELRRAVEAALPGLERDAAALADGPVAVTVQHDDLHGGNVMVDAAGEVRVIDWGDSCVGHPFGVLLVTLRSLRHRERLAGGEVDRVVVAYLESWSDCAGPSDLRELTAAAQRVQAVGRALSWERALAAADETERSAWDDPVTGWLEVVAGLEE
jgi:hypothetical protein